ncbi:MAG: hypothetical protein MUF54_08045, partial [Polyangiaceae bacterium]|nr:hypothetical protein [Polyangiaceae bacterium]
MSNQLRRTPAAKVHPSAKGTGSVLGAEVAWIEVDPLEQLGGHDAGQAAEVVHERHDDAVDKHLSVARGGTADNEQAGETWGTGDARQVLDGSQGVAAGARDLLDLAFLEGPLGDFTRWALSADDHFDLAFGREPVDHFGDFVGGHLLLQRERLVTGGAHGDRIGPGGQVGERPATFLVGGLDAFSAGGVAGDDSSSGQGHVAGAGADLAGQVAERTGGPLACGVGLFGLVRRRGLQGEGIAVQDASGDGLAVAQGGREHKLPGGLDRSLVEAVARGVDDHRLRDLAGGVDVELQHDIALDALPFGFGGVVGENELVELRGLHRGLVRGRWGLSRHDGGAGATAGDCACSGPFVLLGGCR